MRSFVWIKIKGLTLAHIFAGYSLWFIVTFLDEEWQLDYKTAAMGVNIFWGLADIVPILMQHIMDSGIIMSTQMACLSGFAYSIGLGFLSISTIGTCIPDDKNESCHVKKRYKFWFFLALPLLLVGISFHRLDAIEKLLREEKDSRLPNKWLRFWRRVVVIVVNLVGTFALPSKFITQWPLFFGIPAICMWVATLLFLSGLQHRQNAPQSSAIEISAPQSSAIEISAPQSSAIEISAPQSSAIEISAPQSSAIEISAPQSSAIEISASQSNATESSAPESNATESNSLESFLTTMRNVVVASFLVKYTELKQSYDNSSRTRYGHHRFRIVDSSRSTEPNQEHYDNSGTRYGHRLRFLDKAVTNLPNNVDEAKRNMVIRQVEETKQAICRIPFCMAFFMLGVVSSLEDSYFIQQADTMNNCVGGYEVPLVALRLWYTLSNELLGELYWKIMRKLLDDKKLVSSKYAGSVGIVVSMILAIQCCFVAAGVEMVRLDKYHKYGRIDIDQCAIYHKIRMSMFWMLPQYFLIGSFDGILERSVEIMFFYNHPSTSISRFTGLLSMGFFGLGSIGSVLLIFVVRKVSAWGDHTSWFVDNLDDSRLDKYFYLLAGLSIANLIYYTILYYFTCLRSEVRESDSSTS